MKKLFVMAAATLFFAACGGNGGSSSNVEPIKDGVTLETEKYSVMKSLSVMTTLSTPLLRTVLSLPSILWREVLPRAS